MNKKNKQMKKSELKEIIKEEVIDIFNENKTMSKEENKQEENEALHIADVSESKITKRKLLNKLRNIMMELDNDNKIEDIGEKGMNPHIHEFMIDGYLFEVRLMDNL